MRDEMIIAAAIRRARRNAGMTQEALARRAGTSVRTVRAMETATGNPSLRSVSAVARSLGLRLTVK